MLKTSLKYNDDLIARFDIVTTIYAVHTQWLGVALSLTDIDELGSYMYLRMIVLSCNYGWY